LSGHKQKSSVSNGYLSVLITVAPGNWAIQRRGPAVREQRAPVLGNTQEFVTKNLLHAGQSVSGFRFLLLRSLEYYVFMFCFIAFG